LIWRRNYSWFPKKPLYSTFIFHKSRESGPIWLKFEELFFIQLQLLTKSGSKTQNKGTSLNSGDNFNDFYQNHLPLNSPEHKKG
jgi:hypothetical protein